METNPIFISKNLSDFISNYRKDQELVFNEMNTIADAMCGLDITISGLHVDKRTECLLKRAMDAISSYHWLLGMIAESM